MGATDMLIIDGTVYWCNTRDAQKVLNLTYLDKRQKNEYTRIFNITVFTAFVHAYLAMIRFFKINISKIKQFWLPLQPLFVHTGLLELIIRLSMSEP